FLAIETNDDHVTLRGSFNAVGLVQFYLAWNHAHIATVRILHQGYALILMRKLHTITRCWPCLAFAAAQQQGGIETLIAERRVGPDRPALAEEAEHLGGLLNREGRFESQIALLNQIDDKS